MEAVLNTKTSKNIRYFAIPAVILSVAVAFWFWRTGPQPVKPKIASIFQVVSTVVAKSDVSVRLTANGTVSALQTVDIRPQITATIKAVHIREGQFVHKGERLFTLDARIEDANLSRAKAQVVKDRADLANAERNLERQRQLFRQEYISQAELDLAQNQMDGFQSQLAIDQALVEANLVARSYNEIDAPISGRTGAILAYPGSLVQPNGNLTTSGAAMVSITQIDPINVSFTLPERELAGLQHALAKGTVHVNAVLDMPDQPNIKGRLVFIDNAVDTASGTIRLKAEFPNADHRLWPGMFVTVTLASRILHDVVTVPVQAVQTGPEKKFLYVIGEDRKVTALPINVLLIQDGIAVIDGAAPGARIVLEGAQNLRPGSVVSDDRGQKTEGRNSSAQPNGAVRP